MSACTADRPGRRRRPAVDATAAASPASCSPGRAASDWQVRISVAEVEARRAVLAFPGVERWFAVLDGAGVALTIAGARAALRRAGDPPLPFPGDGAVAAGCSTGPTPRPQPDAARRRRRDAAGCRRRGLDAAARVDAASMRWSTAAAAPARRRRDDAGRQPCLVRPGTGRRSPSIPRAPTRPSPAGGWPPTPRRPRMRTLWRNARLATLAEAQRLGLHRARRAARRRRAHRLGRRRRRPAGRPDASTPSTTSAARWSRRAWSTATPTSSTAASARASSSCASGRELRGHRPRRRRHPLHRRGDARRQRRRPVLRRPRSAPWR